MATKVLNGLDLAQTELQNARLQNLASDPSSPVLGQVWYNTTTNRLMYRNNTGNVDALARANHTGTQLAATISDFAATVQASRLDQLAAPTSPVSLNSQRITNLATPTSANDACTKAYVDALINGFDWKVSCRVATTANLNLASPGATIDGVTMASGDRVLVKNQSAGSENGIYVWNGAVAAMTRAADATAGNLTANATVYISEGTASADTTWTLATNDPITVGSTALTWAQAAGGGGSVTAGTGISVAGSTVSIDTAVAVRKYAATIGDGTTTSIAVTHSLGTQDVTVSVRQVSDNAFVECDVVASSTNQITLAFAVAPAASALRVVVHG